MTIIGSIRNRIGLIFGSILIAIVAFLLMDVFSGNSPFSENNRRQNSVGEVDGEAIGYQGYQIRVDQAIENYKINSQTAKVDESTLDMLRDQVWNDILREKIMNKEYEELGLMVGEDELFDMVQGKNVHSSIKQAFANQATGEFDRSQAINFLKNLDKQPKDMQERWMQFEQFILKERVGQKYNALVQKAIYTPTPLVKQFWAEQNQRANGNMVFVDYGTIADSTVTVSKDEMMTYFNNNKSKFKQTKFRKLDYVVFDLKPSSADTAAIYKSINEQYAAFATAADDTSFVALNSDLPFDGSWLNKSNMGSTVTDSILNAPLRSLVGLYLENGFVKITKVIGRGSRPDSVKARHILFKAENGVTPDQIRKTADSVKALIKGGANFAELAKSLSKDPGSGEKGGDLGTFAEGAMVKPFSDACFEGKVGDMPIVESQFGLHLIEVQKLIGSKVAVKLATVARKFEPSTETDREIYNMASQFAGENRTMADFNKTVEAKGYNKRTAERITPTDRNVMNIQGTREVVRWAFEEKNKLGKVSDVFSSDQGYLVASYVGGAEEGTPGFEEVKTQVEPLALKEKKGNMLVDKFNTALTTSGTDLNKLGEKMGNAPMPFSDVTFNSGFIPSLGREPSLVGAIYGAKLKTVSKPVKGDRGVYVFMVNEITKVEPIADAKMIKEQSETGMKQRSQNELFNALKENAKVKDSRYLFY